MAEKRGVRPPDLTRKQAMDLLSPFVGGGVVRIIRGLLAGRASATIAGRSITEASSAEQLRARLANPASNRNMNPSLMSPTEKALTNIAGLRSELVRRGVLRPRGRN